MWVPVVDNAFKNDHKPQQLGRKPNKQETEIEIVIFALVSGKIVLPKGYKGNA